MKTKKIAVLFSGSGSNLEAIIKKVHNKCFNGVKIQIALLICNRPGAFGIVRAGKYGLKTIVINHESFKSKEEFDGVLIEHIKAANVDLTVLAGFMRILTPVFCENVRAINLHPSILPLFKGAHAIKESFESDMQVGGITVHWVSSELDGGKIIAQSTFKRKNRSFKEWEEKIHKLEHKLLPKTIIKLLTTKTEKNDNLNRL